MIRNYLTIAWRNLTRSKIYSLINIFGLALGMTACFFIFQYVHFESSYDRFNTKIDRLYRIPISYSGSFSSVPVTASNHPAVGPAMKRDFPEVESFVRLVTLSRFMNASTLAYPDAKGEMKTFNEGGLYIADSTFFDLFSYPLLAGNRKTCLSEANSVVISRSMETKYFGKEPALGKTLTLNGNLPLKVTGVVADVPEKSHIKFDALISFNSVGREWGYTEWKYPEFYNYVLLAPGADPKKLEAKFPAFVDKYLGEIMKEYKFGCAFHLQPVADIHLQSNYHQEAEANGSEKEVAFLSIIGIFILVIAWINYINLSTAKSMERAKEVGLRKVVGAPRRQLIVQFLFESLVINLLALIVAAILVLSTMPLLHRFIGKDISEGFFTTGMGASFSFWMIIVALFLAGALLVGAYPALVLSSFRPVLVLKGLIAKSTSGISLRRVLVAFQFVLSIILIAATIIVYRQLGFMRNGDLGYQTDQLLIIKAPVYKDSTWPDKFRYFKTEIANNAAVQEVSSTSDIPGSAILYRNSVRKRGADQSEKFNSYLLEADERFVPAYKVEMLAGRTLQSTDSSSMQPGSSTHVLINEVVVKGLGFKTAADAVGQDIILNLGQDEISCRIAGVMKNFHQRSMKEKYDPILTYFPVYTAWRYVSVKVNTASIAQTVSTIQRQYKSVFGSEPFDYFFLDDFFNRQYQADQRLGNVFGLFASLAIIIACLGLLGLSSFMIKLRIKEVGIRKVLGASVPGILLLFSKDFVRLVLIASVIAIPVIWLAAQKWLANYAFHIGLSWFMFVIPPLLLLVIALVTISFQSMKAALSNPVKSLRAE